MLKSHSNAFQWLKAHVWNGAVCLAAGSRRVPGIIWPLTWSARKNVVLIIPKPTSWCKLFVNNHHFSWRVADFFHIIHITMFCHGFPYWLLEFYDFPYIGNVIIPTDEITFFRGVGIPPTSQSLVLFSHFFQSEIKASPPVPVMIWSALEVWKAPSLINQLTMPQALSIVMGCILNG